MTKETELSLILKDMGIELSDDQKDETIIIQMIEARVSEMMENDIDLLMSYLYRLDIEEKKINYILNEQTVIPANTGLAQLIWERQKQRMETKKKHGSGDMIEGWEF